MLASFSMFSMYFPADLDLGFVLARAIGGFTRAPFLGALLDAGGDALLFVGGHEPGADRRGRSLRQSVGQFDHFGDRSMVGADRSSSRAAA